MKKDKVRFLIETPLGDLPCDVFAFFPECVYDSPGILFSSYSHIGQHSACHIDYARKCKEASKEQYKALKKELEGLGYDLKVLNKK